LLFVVIDIDKPNSKKIEDQELVGQASKKEREN
jgi:hypothetical protein